MNGNRERLALACFLAAALLLAVMAARRLTFPHGRALTGALPYGALNFGAAFALAYYAWSGCTPGSARPSWPWSHWPRCWWRWWPA